MRSSSQLITQNLTQEAKPSFIAKNVISEINPSVFYTFSNHEIYYLNATRSILHILDSQTLACKSTIEYKPSDPEEIFRFSEVISSTKIFGERRIEGTKKMVLYDHEKKHMTEFLPSATEICMIEKLPNNKVAALLKNPEGYGTISYHSHITIWDLEEKTPLHISPPMRFRNETLTVLKNGDIAIEYSTTARGCIIIFDTTAFEIKATFWLPQLLKEKVTGQSMTSISENLLAVAIEYTNTIVILNIATQKLHKTLTVESAPSTFIQVKTTSEYLLARSDTGNLHYWDKETFEYLGILAKNCGHMYLFPDDRILAESLPENPEFALSIFSPPTLKTARAADPRIQHTSEVLTDQLNIPKVLSEMVTSYMDYQSHCFFNVKTSQVCETALEEKIMKHRT